MRGIRATLVVLGLLSVVPFIGAQVAFRLLHLSPELAVLPLVAVSILFNFLVARPLILKFVDWMGSK